MGLSWKKSESSVLNNDTSQRVYKILPPHAKQRHIVATEEELMALVDALEMQPAARKKAKTP